MPKYCCVAYCVNNSAKTTGISYCQIPTDPEKKLIWCKAIRRAATASDGRVIPGKLWEPKSVHNYVCSEHFISGG